MQNLGKVSSIPIFKCHLKVGHSNSLIEVIYATIVLLCPFDAYISEKENLSNLQKNLQLHVRLNCLRFDG